MDPAAITLCQSSPIVFGKNYGKDCRTLVYRDMFIPGELEGLYIEYPIFGGLPHYEFTLEDIKNLSIKRKNMFVELLHTKGIMTKEMSKEIFFSPDLRFMWGPLRVNHIGTIEYRGLDMNLPSKLFSIANLIKTGFDMVKELELNIVPSDIGIDEPFKIEDENVILPPFSIARSVEYLGSRFGLENSSVYTYAKRFYDMISKNSDGVDKKRLGAESLFCY